MFTEFVDSYVETLLSAEFCELESGVFFRITPDGPVYLKIGRGLIFDWSTRRWEAHSSVGLTLQTRVHPQRTQIHCGNIYE